MASMNTILANAVASIQLGIEDYQSNGKHRSLSALRNISAGVLLLFKEKLARMAPDEVLIKKDAQLSWKDGHASWLPAGDKTVDFHGIKERFKLTGLKFDFSETTLILDQRNRIEHYVADIPAKTLRGTIAKAVIVIGRFCREHLGEQAATLIGPDIWQVMLQEQAINDAEVQACQARMRQVKWPYPELEEMMTGHHTCGMCGSELGSPVDPNVPLEQLRLSCASCGHVEDYASAIEPAFVSWAATNNYASIKDGGDPVSEDCDQCLSDLVIASSGYCVRCGYLRYETCQRCQQQFLKGRYCERCDATDGQTD
jgi:hypothetical protein